MRRAAAAAVAVLAAPAAARAQFPPELRGRVVEAATGAPVAGARVEPAGGAERAVTGPDGGFVLRGLEPGARTLRVTAVGFRPAEPAAELANGRVTRLTVPLARAVALGAVRVTAAAERAPAGAVVLDRERIVRSQARELGELLQDEAGLVVTRRGAGGGSTVSVRGAAASQLLVLLDGTPVNDPLTNAADLSAVPLEAVERVTVVKGAASARYGAGALAGVVAVETRRAGAAELALRGGGGAYGERVAAASAGAARAVGAGGATLGGLAVAELQSSRNGFDFPLPAFRGGGDDVRRNADGRTASLLATGTLARAGAELRLRADLLDVDRGMPGFATQQSPTARQTQRRAGATAAGRLARGAWDAAADVAVQEQRVRYADPSPPSVQAYDDSVRVSTVRAAAQAGLTGARGAVRAGGELRALSFRATQLAPGAPTGQRLGGAWTDARLWRGAADGVRAELFGGLRVDAGARLPAPAASPRVGVSLGSARAAGRVAWGRAFSPPSLVDQFFQEGVRARPNPDLRPERVRGEVEVAGDLRALRVGPATVSASAAAYRADVRGMIVWAPNFRFEWRPENVDVRRRGADLSAEARFAPADLALRAAASRTEVEYATAAVAGQVVYRPRESASAGAAATVAGVRLDVAGRWVGPRRTVAGSALNALPAYAVADLRAERPFALGAWRGAVALGVDDLLDRQPAMLVDFPSPGRSWRLMVRLRRPGSSPGGDAPP